MNTTTGQEHATPEQGGGSLITWEITIRGLTEDQFNRLGEAIGEPLGRYKEYAARYGVHLNDEQHDITAAIRFARANGLLYEQTVTTLHRPQ